MKVVRILWILMQICQKFKFDFLSTKQPLSSSTSTPKSPPPPVCSVMKTSEIPKSGCRASDLKVCTKKMMQLNSSILKRL
jgi:DNA primase large subunit